MAQRKPSGLSFDSWIDRQIDKAHKEGEFDQLPGKGKPLSAIDGQYSDDWWIKDKLKRENLDLAPETIVSRREVENWLSLFLDLPTADEVRRQANRLNETIQRANETDLGPFLPQKLLSVESLIEQ